MRIGRRGRSFQRSCTGRHTGRPVSRELRRTAGKSWHGCVCTRLSRADGFRQVTALFKEAVLRPPPARAWRAARHAARSRIRAIRATILPATSPFPMSAIHTRVAASTVWRCGCPRGSDCVQRRKARDAAIAIDMRSLVGVSRRRVEPRGDEERPWAANPRRYRGPVDGSG